MFAESDDSLLAQFPDKRPASPSFEGDTRCDKKSRLQAVEPDFDQEFLGLFESYYLPSFTPTFNDVPWDDSYMELDGGDDIELVFSCAESPAPDTLPDTCFGVIAVSANSLFFRSRQESQATTAAVDMRPCGSFIKLYTLDSSKYAGIITEPAILTLLSELSVKVNASLIAPEPRLSKSKAET